MSSNQCSIFDPSQVVLSLEHHDFDQAFKSPSMIKKDGRISSLDLKANLNRNKNNSTYYLSDYEICT